MKQRATHVRRTGWPFVLALRLQHVETFIPIPYQGYLCWLRYRLLDARYRVCLRQLCLAVLPSSLIWNRKYPFLRKDEKSELSFSEFGFYE
jgi:hypothetical protein